MLLLLRDEHNTAPGLPGDRQVLLAERAGTGYADGCFNLPSGKVEPGEDALSAVVRESWEEVGLRLRPSELRLVTTVHHRNPEGATRIGLFFAADWTPTQGEPRNAEPDKCARIEWSPLDKLPSSTYSYTAAGVEAFRAGRPFAVDGWQ